jgi:cytoskeletal protein CcmA (bactofilin family)
MEEAEILQHWREPTTRFHLCGEECLYRKLSGMLVRGLDGPVNRTHLAQNPSPQCTGGGRGLNANIPVSKYENGPEASSWLRLTMRGALVRILGFRNHLEKTAPDSPCSSLNTATGMSQRAPSPRLRGAAAVDASLRITGRILSGEALHVNGEVAGTLELPDGRLTVGPNGNIRAAVSAKEVEIFGVVEGEIKADRVVVRKNATLVGDVCTRALVIEGGAWFEGSSSMGSRDDHRCDNRL